jgi:hypothetical protein
LRKRVIDGSTTGLGTESSFINDIFVINDIINDIRRSSSMTSSPTAGLVREPRKLASVRYNSMSDGGANSESDRSAGLFRQKA